MERLNGQIMQNKKLKIERLDTLEIKYIVMDVLQTANRRQTEGKDVLHLELGQPATGASQVLGCADGIFNNH